MSAPLVGSDRLLNIHAVAVRFYRGHLASEEGTGPLRFLARRGVPVDGQWVVGYAPDRPAALINELRRREFDDVEIRASGLATTGRSGQLVDRFRNRVMVGVREGPGPDAPVVGFAGYAPPRAAPDVAPCLYSPGTAVFRPRNVLFGLAEQRDRIGGRLILASDPLEAIALTSRSEHERRPPLVVAPPSRWLSRRHVAALAQAADLNDGLVMAVGPDDDRRRAAEHAYRLLAPIVPSNKLLAAGPDARSEKRRPLIEALVVARVDRAAETLIGDAERSAAARSATALLAGEDAEVAARLTSYIRRRLGPEPGVGQAVQEPGHADPTAGRGARTRRARTQPKLTQLAFDFDALHREAGGTRTPETPERQGPRGGGPQAGKRPEESAPAQEPAHEPALPQEEARAAQAAPEEDAVPAKDAADAETATPPEGSPRPEQAARPEQAPQPEPTPPTEQAAQPEAPRFRPSGQQDLAPSGERARVEANLAAIRALRAQTAEQRPPTPEEQALYARWSGWGATPLLFDERDRFKERFASERAELRELLGEQGYRAARATTLNAHYTDAAYVQATWSALRELGFAGGRVLEPGCGSGNFIGFAPDGTREVGVELDPTTAAIAQVLYPDAEIRAESFADTRFSPGTFDLTVGNVPFGDHKLSDRDHNPGRRHSIHNHFILKSLRLTRPGGMVAVITSRYTMDGEDEAHALARSQMGDLADLIGAVRLPSGAHNLAAGTEVVTDLLILRRREDGRAPETAAWQQVRSTEVPAARPAVPPAAFAINEYFLHHPEQVLGNAVAESGPYGPKLSVLSDGPTAPALVEALKRIVARAQERGLTITPPAPALAEEPSIPVSGPMDQPDGTFLHVGNGRFAQIRDGRSLPHYPPKTQATELRALIELRDTVLALLDEEAAHEQDTWRMNELRVELNARYDRYVSSYGSINRYKAQAGTRVNKDTGEVVETERRRYPQLGGFREDPFFPYVTALEKFDDETQATDKADIFRQRVVVPRAPADRAASPDDALVICWDSHNEVRLDEIARLLGLGTDQEAREALGTLVYDEPCSGRLVRRAEYLSGNVRKKLAEAEQAAAEDPRITVNVEALRAVVPRDLTPGEIGARLGSPWIDASYVQQFLREILEDEGITVSNVGARWSVSGGSTTTVLSTAVWGTAKRSAQELASNLLNSQSISIRTTIGSGHNTSTIKDEEATAIAQAKADQLDERFRAWLWEEPRRATELSRLYNDRFNALVPQSFDGEHVAAPGMSAAAFELRPHQMAAVARIRNTAGAGLFHGTGAGKTLEMIVGGMELRRLGLVQKPAYVVPKAVVGQFQREFLQAYPRARVLAVDSEELTGDKRRQFVARCSTGDWDAVIISHTAFKKVPVSKDIRVAYLTRQQERLLEFLTNADEEADRRTVKEIQKRIENLGERIKEQLAHPTDPGVEFQRTGIDYLFIDEAHTYKNLAVLSSIQELAHPGNEITRDLDMKLGYLRQRYGRRVVTLATATPIDNSPSEIMTMLKYAAPEILEELGIKDDDQFHAAFIQPRRRLEMKPDGSGFESRMRHARFVNIPELKRAMFSFADVKLKKNLPLDEPAIVGGKPEILGVPASVELREYLAALASRARVATGGNPPLRPNAKGEMKPDNILWISNDGRMASLDLRLLDRRTDEPQKIDVLADRIAGLWRKHRDDVYYAPDGTPEAIRGSLQLAFCDLGVPGKDRWSLYEALRDELVARGMPAGQIRFAQEATNRRKKDQLQRDARDGKISVLIGSRAGLGTGVNIQRRVVAVFQVDPTWKLTPIEQSLGRGKRQGNMNAEIHHIFLVTENSYDPFLWQKVDDKARFTEQMLDASETTRTIDAQDQDNGGRIDASVMFAVGAGRPELLELARLEETLAVLRLERTIWHDEQVTYKATIDQSRHSIARLERDIAEIDAVLSRRWDTRGDAFEMTLEGRRFKKRPSAGAAMIDRIVNAAHDRQGRPPLRLELGELGNIPLIATVYHESNARPFVVLTLEGVTGPALSEYMDAFSERDATGLIRSLENRLFNLDEDRRNAAEALERVHANIAQAEARLGQPFPRQAELKECEEKFAALQKVLEDATKAPSSQITRARSHSERPKVAQAPSETDHARAPPEVSAPPVVPGTVAQGLPEAVQPARGAVAELEAAALTDPKLTQAARVNDKGNFALVVREWIDDYVVTKAMADDTPDLAAFRQKVADTLNDYIVDRLWALRDVGAAQDVEKDGPEPTSQVPASLRAQAELLGTERWAWIASRANEIAEDATARNVIALRDHATGCFDQLDPAAARETLGVERDKRIALEAARQAAALAVDLDSRAESAKAHGQRGFQRELEERADVEQTTASSERHRLAQHIQREWRLFDDDRHSSQWTAKLGEAAAIEVASERQRGGEQQLAKAPSHPRNPAREVPDVGVGVGVA